VAAVLMALVATACGNPPTGRAAVPGPQLLQQSVSVLQGKSLVHVAGTISEKQGSSTDSITVYATSNSADASQGTLDLEGPGLGFTGSTRFIVVSGETYVKAGSSFWSSLFGKQTASVRSLEGEILPEVLNRWVLLSSASTDVIYKDTFGLSEPRVFVSGTLQGMKGTISNDGDRSIDGVHGVEVDSSKGSEVVVAATGSPLPLELAADPATSAFHLDLRVTYPANMPITAPLHPVSLAGIEAALSGPSSGGA
jgi:hypothetical protein